MEAPTRGPAHSSGRLHLFLAYCLVVLVVYVASLPRMAAPGFPFWGPGDFTIFYTAAHIIRNGDAHRLYDLQVQAQVQQAFLLPHGWTFANGLLPYDYPPFVAVLFVPLSFLPLAAAFNVWSLANIALILASTKLLLARLGRSSSRDFVVASLVVFSFPPVLEVVSKGQSTGAVLFALTVAVLAAERRRDALAGMALGLAMLKPQLALLVGVLLVLRTGRRTALAFLATAGGLAGVSWLLVGTDGLAEYVGLLRAMGSWDGLYNFNPAYMFNLRGTAYRLRDAVDTGLGASLPAALTDAATLVLSLAVLALVISTWRRAAGMGRSGRDLQLAQAAGTTILLSPHLYDHDLALLVLAGFALLSYGQEQARRGLAWSAVGSVHGAYVLVLICMSILPVAMLTAYQAGAQLVVCVLAGFSLAIWREAARPQYPPRSSFAYSSR